MSSLAETITAVNTRRAERERHRLAYAYHLGRLVGAAHMPEDWRRENTASIHAIAEECRQERALATGTTLLEADRLWGTVTDAATDVVRGMTVELEAVTS